MSATVLHPPRRLRSRTLRVAGREQALVAGGQLAAGIGNLGFALVCAHVLAPREYSRLAAFLAAYLLLYMPFSSLAAGGALVPEAIHQRRRHGFLLGAGIAGVLLVGAAAGLGPALGLGTPLLLLLAGAAPVAGLLSLERGRTLGSGGQQTAIASLISEPVVRIGVGIIAAVGLGAPGAAAAVVMGGYVGLVLAVRRPTGRQGPLVAQDTSAATHSTTVVTLAFLLLALLQNQDVLWANARLAGPQAAYFAVLSTLGGIAAFASTTVPLVLLPRVRRRETGALAAAVAAAGALGAGALLPFMIDGSGLISVIFGARYAAVAPLAVPYLGAMALLGISRVIVAYRCAVSTARPVIALLLACATGQALLIILLGTDAGAVSHATLAASAALALGLGALALRARPSRERRRAIGVSLAMAGRASRRDAVSALVPRAVADDLSAVADVTAAPSPVREPTPMPEPSLAPEAKPVSPPIRRRLPTTLRRPAWRAGLTAAWTRVHSRSAVMPATVAALTIGGLVLRLLAGRSLWLDEATSITQAHMSFSGMWNSLRSSDVQPPLHDTLLWLINHVVGDSELAMRSPSLLAGTLLIPVVYAIGHDLWDRRTGLIAAVLTTVAPFAIWYSQEARMYAVFMLLTSLALWAQVRILEAQSEPGQRRWRWWALYSVSTAAVAWTQYLGSLFAVVQQVAFVIAIVRLRENRRDLVLPWLASLAFMAVLVAPLVPFMMHQFQVNQTAGRGFGATPSQNGSALEAGHRIPTVYAVLTNLVWGIWGYHSTPTMASLTALWPLGVLLVLALLGRGRSWRTALLVALAGFPIAMLFVVGQFKPFLFEIRYFCAGVPVAMLLIGRLCANWPGRRTIGTVLLTAVFALSFVLALGDQQFSQTNPRLYDFQGALARISHVYKPGDELLYAPSYLNDLAQYYAPHVRGAPLPAYPAHVAPHAHVFVMASFQDNPASAHFVHGAISDMLRAGRAEIRYFTRPQVQIWEFR
jgi:4-amino-4-deoxy-L-arabinose transferase-like glycosyltransferase